MKCRGVRPSVVFFSHYRSASMMLNRRLLELIDGHDYCQLDYQGYVHPWSIERREDFQRDVEGHKQCGRFPEKGYYFGPLRYFVDIPALEKMKVIVVLRDPRDVLVSRYYSEKYNHVRLDKRFLAHCESIEKLSLDEFVLAYREDVKSHYDLYLKKAEQLANALTVNYEEMVGDFEGFLRKVNDYLELGRDEKFIQSITKQENFDVKKEDVYSHKRSVQPRNFEKKLKDATIKDLNSCFADVLTAFKWKV